VIPPAWLHSLVFKVDDDIVILGVSIKGTQQVRGSFNFQTSVPQLNS